MIRAFIKATDQILDPITRRVVWTALLSGVGVFALLWAIVGALLLNTAFFTVGWINIIFNWFGGLATGALTWLLFPAAMSAIISFFLEAMGAFTARTGWQIGRPSLLSWSFSHHI